MLHGMQASLAPEIEASPSGKLAGRLRGVLENQTPLAQAAAGVRVLLVEALNDARDDPQHPLAPTYAALMVKVAADPSVQVRMLPVKCSVSVCWRACD